MLEARLAKLRQKKMKKSKEDGTEEEKSGTSWFVFLNFKRKTFRAISISIIGLLIRKLAIEFCSLSKHL